MYICIIYIYYTHVYYISCTHSHTHKFYLLNCPRIPHVFACLKFSKLLTNDWGDYFGKEIGNNKMSQKQLACVYKCLFIILYRFVVTSCSFAV